MDYFPFGAIRLDEKSGTFDEQRKYIGQEYDKETGLDYLNARYYNPRAGIFISQDPMFWSEKINLSNPQEYNSYSYAANNPIIKSDPTGLLVVTVPGTSLFGTRKEFNNDQLNENISNAFPGQKSVVFNWGGGDNARARNKAADKLSERINSELSSLPSNEPLNLVCHSHGCNITALYTQKDNARQIDNLVSFGAPVRKDYTYNKGKIDNFISVYSNKDWVQRLAGGQAKTSGLFGTLACGRICGFAGTQLGWGEFGKAERVVPNADHKLDVTATSGWNRVGNHSDLYQNKDVWEKVNKYIDK